MTKQRLTRAERSAQTRAELMASARQLFLRRGFHASSLELVAEEAGFPIGAVYSRFGSKADLFLAILDERIDQLVAEVAQVAALDQPLSEHAELLAGRRMALLEREREWFPLVRRVLVARGPRRAPAARVRPATSAWSAPTPA